MSSLEFLFIDKLASSHYSLNCIDLILFDHHVSLNNFLPCFTYLGALRTRNGSILNTVKTKIGKTKINFIIIPLKTLLNYGEHEHVLCISIYKYKTNRTNKEHLAKYWNYIRR